MRLLKISSVFCFMFLAFTMNAQKYAYNNSATVVAQNYDISDNLDLKAVASIFGDSRDLEDFERRLNDPSAQISNLDLNRDNIVDYLRVIEVADNDARVIVIQSVLGEDLFQDVATIELERESKVVSSSSPNINIQIVGNPYLYGANYIYEPFYSVRPLFFDMFWGVGYRPYYSPWYWGYYPTYYNTWAPMPIHRYRRHIYPAINHRNRYVYADTRRVVRADRMYSGVSRRGYEQSNPNRSFSQRNNNVQNRYSLDANRSNGRESSRSSVGTFNRTSDSRVNSSLDRANVKNSSISNDRAVNVRSNTVQVRGNDNFKGSSSLRAEVPQSNRIERANRNTTTTSSGVLQNSRNVNNNSQVRSNNDFSRSNDSYRNSSNNSFSRGSSNSSFSRGSSTMPSMQSGSSMSRGSSSMPSSGGRSGGSQRSGR